MIKKERMCLITKGGLNKNCLFKKAYSFGTFFLGFTLDFCFLISHTSFLFYFLKIQLNLCTHLS